MTNFAIIEVDDGMTVVEIQSGQTAEDAAVVGGGLLVDPGPYATYEDAVDAMEQLEEDDEEDQIV